MGLSLDSLVKFFQSGATFPLGVTVLIIWSIYNGWFVSGSSHKSIVDIYERMIDDVRRERDDWKEIALTTTNAADRAVSLAERRRKDANR